MLPEPLACQTRPATGHIGSTIRPGKLVNLKIAYFTAGSSGAGHWMRGLAIRRPGTSRVPGRFSDVSAPPCGAAPPPGTAIERSGSPCRSCTTREGDGERQRQVVEFSPDLLLIDVFWSALRWVLPLPGCGAGLARPHRPPRLANSPGGWGPVRGGGSRTYLKIEPFPGPGQTEDEVEEIDPIVVCNPDECRPLGQVRERLLVPRHLPVNIIAHSAAR